MNTTLFRKIGTTQISISPVSMGCWPITGITSPGTTKDQGLATLRQAVDCGINFFDTAYCYGYQGESECMIAEAIGSQRDKIVIASKGGIHWNADQVQQKDARPVTIIRQCEESLSRLGTDRIDLYYLHAPDPNVSVTDSADAFVQLKKAGKIRCVGVSNFNVEQLKQFQTVCKIDAFQPHYNMLQREIERSTLPWCAANSVSVMVYWPLLKGMLAGKLKRDQVFEGKDGRKKYPMFKGDEYQKNLDFVDRLREFADSIGVNVPQLVVNWTIQQSGITSAICGAKRPEQIRDTAGSMQWSLTTEQLAMIDGFIKDRGQPETKAAV